MVQYSRVMSTRSTLQSEPIPGKPQEQNNAGGYSFVVDDWARLDRFLVLGSESSTYYVGERKLTRDNAEGVLRCIQKNGTFTVQRIVEISDAGRAPKNDPAIFALALCIKFGDTTTRQAAYTAIPKVCRIGTHIFALAEALKDLGKGWGSGTVKAFQSWYMERPLGELAYQMVKYQDRNNWRHHDLLHMCHPKTQDEGRNILFGWAKTGWESVGELPHDNPDLGIIWAFEKAKSASEDELVSLIGTYNLPREAIPSEALKSPKVWEALLRKMPMTAMIRNLATMTKVGLLTTSSEATKLVCQRLDDVDILRKARVHPIALLSAERVYAQGHGERSSATWNPVSRIVDALDAAFYTSFQIVEPAGKRFLLALDVSGSMESGEIAGVPGLTPRVASGALCMVSLATEPDTQVVAFTSASGSWYRDTAITPIPLSKRQRLDNVLGLISDLDYGATDCALPMLWAAQNNIPVDTFVIYTDSETWAGKIHPAQALTEYREKMGIPSKLVVVGMTATEFTIADPSDRGQLDVVGFDTATPQLISQFAAE